MRRKVIILNGGVNGYNMERFITEIGIINGSVAVAFGLHHGGG